MVILIYFLVFASVFLAVYFLSGKLISVIFRWHQKTIEKASSQLDNSFVFLEKRKIMIVTIAPIILAGLGFLIVGNIIGIIAGLIVGAMIPSIMVRIAKQKRIKDFQGQMIDILMIFSSALKGGLSFVQALEIVCEEMPSPASQEFGLVLKENRLGVSLEDSLEALRKRMCLEEVNLMVSSILVAKETGGELTKVFSRLIGTIRDNLKLKEKVNTLTLQGKMQGMIMSLMPILFTLFIYRQNPHHFDIMFQSELGKKLLVMAVLAQIIGIFMIKKISTYRG